MKKFFKIVGVFLGVLILLIFALQFIGFSIGNVTIGKQKNDLASETVHSLENSSFHKEILQTNKITCVNIWATWCVPCIAEMPELNKIEQEFHGKNIQFVSLSIDKDSVKLRNFINSKKFKFKDITFQNIKYNKAILNYLEGKPINFENSGQMIPITYILKGGKVVKKFEGGIDSAELRKEIEKNIL